MISQEIRNEFCQIFSFEIPDHYDVNDLANFCFREDAFKYKKGLRDLTSDLDEVRTFLQDIYLVCSQGVQERIRKGFLGTATTTHEEMLSRIMRYNTTNI